MKDNKKMSMTHIRVTERVSGFASKLKDTDCIAAGHGMTGSPTGFFGIYAWSFLKSQQAILANGSSISVLHLMVLLGSGHVMRSQNDPWEFLEAFNDWHRTEEARDANMYWGSPDRQSSITSLIDTNLNIKLKFHFTTFD